MENIDRISEIKASIDAERTIRRVDVKYLLSEITAMQTELAQLREAQRWIPVSEPPKTIQNENGEPIEFNVMLPNASEATTLCFDGFQWFHMDWKNCKVDGYYTVKYWQPLPPAPPANGGGKE